MKTLWIKPERKWSRKKAHEKKRREEMAELKRNSEYVRATRPPVCERCGDWVGEGGEIHHKIYRRKLPVNRRHKPENLELLCADCHRREHS